MCDDLLAQHHRISAPSHIPLSNNPTWFTTQFYSDRSQNRTWLFLPPESLERINFSDFYEINPKWTIFSLDKRVLKMFERADRVEMVFEMMMVRRTMGLGGGGGAGSNTASNSNNITRNNTPPPDGLRITEDGDWFRETYPDKATLANEEDVLTLVDTASGARTGFVTFLADSTRLYISEISVSEEHHRSHRGKDIARRLLQAVVDLAEQSRLKVWVMAHAEEAEALGIYFDFGFVVNRTLWRVEKNTVSENEEKAAVAIGKEPDWKFGKWETGIAMVGWKDWSATLVGSLKQQLWSSAFGKFKIMGGGKA